jgi:hypothetical protein
MRQHFWHYFAVFILFLAAVNISKKLAKLDIGTRNGSGAVLKAQHMIRC